ncbi:hypothetical protein HID58_046148 [Brassica napus]|uniref:Protein kinase domain-containing protein n=1 Tax=Brassica napus TaxID=3708 RepID=A0ABQ8AVJ6_BRANA|nr:hypothetical protein HID58_046148 [Brassica napus]
MVYLAREIKKKKQSIVMDRLSQLPDDLLIKILSFVPTKCAVATSILSKRWLSLWTLVASLVFEDFSEEEDEEINEIHGLCYLHKAAVLERFHLNSTSECSAWEIGLWVRIAVDRFVRDLKISFCYDHCLTLETLQLRRVILSEVPCRLSFPSLTKLRLLSVKYSDDGSFSRIVSNCPILDDLVVETCHGDNVATFTVNLPSLQRNRGRERNRHRFGEKELLRIKELESVPKASTSCQLNLCCESHSETTFRSESKDAILEQSVVWRFAKLCNVHKRRWKSLLKMMQKLEGLKYEKKCCIDQLECNLVVIKKSQPKVIRLNLVKNADTEHLEAISRLTTKSILSRRSSRPRKKLREPFVTPARSPDQEGSDMGTSSISSSDARASPFLASQVSEGLNPWVSDGNKSFFESDTGSNGENWSPISMASSSSHPVKTSNILSPSDDLTRPHTETPRKSRFSSVLRLGSSKKEPDVRKSDTCLNKSVREVVSLSRKSAPGPPPLCSICQHKAPKFGNPPRWFTYDELETATKGFSKGSFLAEGGFGSVHRGTLPGGQIIAVKQYKIASTQGDKEFCSEVEVLSCAQHRNVVMLIGLCVEDGKRLLVYEYICNGSLHSHLYGLGKEPLGWSARQKIAVGAARGLRYLHEECRVGCIVHRDMRPNNILLTHDFEPLVGDFGLARWQPEGDKGVETRVIGTFGYLAPEYTQSGQITEKADVYSFGVVLVELITGRKAMDIKRPKGQQCLTEWARPLLQKQAIKELLDPRLMNCYSEQEVYCMALCAYLCIRRDPNSRPRMSQMKEKAEASEKKKNANVKRRKGAAAKRRAAIKKKRKAAKRSETPEKKRKRDSGLDGGSSSNPSKRTRNRVRETAASPPEHQGGDSEGTPHPVIPSQPQKSPTPTHAASEAENQQQPRVTSGSSTKSPSHRVDKQNGEEIGSNNRDSNAPEVVVDNDAPRTEIISILEPQGYEADLLYEIMDEGIYEDLELIKMVRNRSRQRLRS